MLEDLFSTIIVNPFSYEIVITSILLECVKLIFIVLNKPISLENKPAFFQLQLSKQTIMQKTWPFVCSIR